MKNVYKYFNKLDSLDFKKNKRKLFWLIPYYLHLEKTCKKEIWNKTVLNELITNDTLFSYFDDNDFEFIKKGAHFRKIDTVDSVEFLFNNTNDLKEKLKAKFVRELTTLIRQQSPFDIEEYINMYINIDLKVVFDDFGNSYKANIYEVIIRYCREYQYGKMKKIFYGWLIMFISFIVLILGICLYFYI